ncbi:MAG TPA: hypothetical protein VF476_08940 [Chitinophagaceae bacterium]
MRLSHPDYIKLVIGTYHKMRANNEISLLLARPTPANLRKECMIVYRKGYERRDEPVFRAFFGPEEPEKLLEIIQEFELKKFKPLTTYLKRPDKKGVNDTNLELLAWLIKFRHRPYIYGRDVLLNDEELSILGEPIKGEEKPPVPGTGKDKTKEETTISTKAVILFLILVFCMGGIYMLWQEKRRQQIAYGNTNADCMYWAEDHYEEVPCNEDRNDRIKFPMDREKMKSFKKILRKDTITEKSIGKVHYISVKARLEFYTTGGHHPVDVTRTLRPLTYYMYVKHLRNKPETANKDSVTGGDARLVNNR